MPIPQRQNSCDIIYYYSILFYVGVMTIIVSHKVCACVSWNLNDYRLYNYHNTGTKYLLYLYFISLNIHNYVI